MSIRTLTKMDLAKELAAGSRHPLTREAAVGIIELITDIIGAHFQEGGNVVTIRGFGTLEVQTRRAFETTDPTTGKRFKVRSTKTVGFRPGDNLKRRINS